MTISNITYSIHVKIWDKIIINVVLRIKKSLYGSFRAVDSDKTTIYLRCFQDY